MTKSLEGIPRIKSNKEIREFFFKTKVTLFCYTQPSVLSCLHLRCRFFFLFYFISLKFKKKGFAIDEVQ